MAQPAFGISPASDSPLVHRETPVPAAPATDADVIRYIDLKLAALGYPANQHADSDLLEIARPLLRNYHQKDMMLGNLQCPSDRRIQSFLDSDLEGRLPRRRRAASRQHVSAGPARARAGDVAAGARRHVRVALSCSRIVFRRESCTIPRAIAAPRKAFSTLSKAVCRFRPISWRFRREPSPPCSPRRLRPPASLLTLPFTADQSDPVRCSFRCCCARVVCPATERDPLKTMEIRFFAPGSLVSNLDFVEAIFGNGGDPYLPENDAALDVMHWTGHTGCVIVAPHLAGMKKKDLGLPHERGCNGPAAPRRNVLARSRRALQRRRLVQGSLPRRDAASWSRSSPTTTTAIARRK